MPSYQPPLRDFEFVLFEVLRADEFWQRTAAHADTSREFAVSILAEASKVLVNEWLPLNRSGDEEGARFAGGTVHAPAGFKRAYDAWAEGGWLGLSGDPNHGGQGLPRALTVGIDEMQYACNTNLNLYFTLTSGACVLLAAHADESTKARYLPNMYAGKWGGVMALTESQAGTDLGLIRTRASPRGDGSFSVSGTKIFITAGEHDLAENIIHLVLARLPDAPAGSGGISLFLVPKYLVNEDGSLGKRNGVVSAGIEHKMGIHGSATNVMQYEGAIGWLIGEPHRGLASMFTMMNYERLSVGTQGLGLGEIAYQNSRKYARERLQGRVEDSSSRSMQTHRQADPIIGHADVRRMLLTQRALNEGGRAFAMLVGMALDVAKQSTDEKERAWAERRVSLLTPVAKAFFTDRGFEGCVQAQQVLGGHGYVREWGVEQFVRDARIAQIYEGTNGVQAMDLLGRKVVRDGGQALNDWLTELRTHLQTAPKDLSSALNDSIELLATVSQELISAAKVDRNVIGAAAVAYLDLFGYVAYASLWARLASSADVRSADPFCQGKSRMARFYFAQVLPRVQSLAASIRSGPTTLMSFSDENI